LLLKGSRSEASFIDGTLVVVPLVVCISYSK
jgi:hypothetical protein